MQKAKDIAKSAVGKENRPHDYYHGRPFWRPFSGSFYSLLGIAIVGASAWAYWGSGRWAYMNGPLAPHHANIDCNDCHRMSFSYVSDAACHSCHGQTIEVDGRYRAVHHPVEGRDSARCTFCHREHHGDVALSALPDQDCVRCHGELPSENVRRTTLFDAEQGDHPEFALWREGAAEDPGSLKFPHKLHMDPAGVLAGPPEDPNNRRFLSCKDCHVPDAKGEGMLPINYEKHCGTCHAHKIHALNEGDVPHENPEEIRAYLLKYFHAHPAEADPAGGMDSRQPRPWLDQSELERTIIARVKFEESNLYGGKKLEGYSRCDQCHHLTAGATSGIAGLSPLPTLVPPNIPDRWYKHARFSHAAHDSSQLECDDCHGLRRPGESEVARVVESASATDVLIPRMEDCTVCHTSGKDVNQCTLCHTFHPDGDEPHPHTQGGASLSAQAQRVPVSDRIAQIGEGVEP